VTSIDYLQDINWRWIILETYFHNDPQIKKWINHIIERIFAVCILTGVDSDEEFQKGCEIVTKLTTFLKDIPNVPSESLMDGVKQLLEQQLPDARVINNFPAFQGIMDKMLSEGLLKVIGTQTREPHRNISDTVISKEINLEPHDSYTVTKEEIQLKADCEKLAEALAQFEIQAKADYKVLAEALAHAENKSKADAEKLAEALGQAEIQSKADAEKLAEALSQAEIQAKTDAEKLAEALGQAEIQSKADAEKLAEALAEAKIQTNADAQILAEALAEAEIQSKADAQKLAEALGQAEIQSKADAEKLAEALAEAEIQTKADAEKLAEALAEAKIQAKTDAEKLAEALAQAEIQTKADAEKLAEALGQADIRAKADALALTNALAQVNVLTQAESQAKVDALAFSEALAQLDTKLEAITLRQRDELAKPLSIKNEDFIEQVSLIKLPALFTSINTKITQVYNTSKIPQHAELLRQVLSKIFPKGTVYWNKILMGETFLAQVEDILICLHDPESPCNTKKFNKDGWKVLVCSREDLMFPRRLGREIRQIQRSGKMSETV